MYDLPYFKATANADVIAFMKAHPFVTICGVDANHCPVATQVPVLLNDDGQTLILQTHVMRQQDHTIAFENNPNVMVIFSGANAYVSASWYTVPNVASTWNYQAVYAKGIIHFMPESDLHNLLIKTTHHFEGSADSSAAVKYMDAKYVHNHIKAIVGIEIEITQLNHVFKLSQNKDDESKKNIITQLSNGDVNARKIAQSMKKIDE